MAMVAPSIAPLPGLLGSSLGAINAGTDLLGTAATELAGLGSSAASSNSSASELPAATNAISGVMPALDTAPNLSLPQAQGVADLIRGQTSILSGIALAHAYQSVTSDLMNMLNPATGPTGRPTADRPQRLW